MGAAQAMERKDQRRTESQFFMLGRRDTILERFSARLNAGVES